MNRKLFEVQMVLHDETQVTVAEAIGVQRNTLYRKLSEAEDKNGNKAGFSQDEIKTLIDRWELSPDDVSAIFFN